jgi:hypothetical protein
VRRMLRLAVLGVVALFATVLGGTVAQAAPADFLIVNGHARLVNVNSGKCLGISAAGQADGTFAVQWTCQGTAGSDQHMLIQPVASGSLWHTIKPQHSPNKCLAVSAASTARGTSLIQWRCTGGHEQQFAFQETPTGLEILIRHSDQRVAVSAAHTGKGGRIVQWTANSGNEQRWLFQGVPG